MSLKLRLSRALHDTGSDPDTAPIEESPDPHQAPPGSGNHAPRHALRASSPLTFGKPCSASQLSPSTTQDRKGILFFKQLLFLSFTCKLKFRSLTTGGKRYYCLEPCPEKLGAELPPDSAQLPAPIARPRCHPVFTGSKASRSPSSARASPGQSVEDVGGERAAPDEQTRSNSQHLFCQEINIPLHCTDSQPINVP